MKNKLTLEDVLEMFRTVIEWNSYAGNLPSDKTLDKVYHQLTVAEFSGKNEFLVGVHSHNDELILDGVADLTFTSFMWAAINGMDEELLKATFNTAEICSGFGEATYGGTIKLMDYYIEEKDSFQFVRELLTFMLITEYKYDFVGSFGEVQASNLSKFPKVEDVKCPETELEIILDKGRYVGLDYKEINGRYIFTAMQDLEDGVRFDKPKVIKPSIFQDVKDLQRFVYK